MEPHLQNFSNPTDPPMNKISVISRVDKGTLTDPVPFLSTFGNSHRRQSSFFDYSQLTNSVPFRSHSRTAFDTPLSRAYRLTLPASYYQFEEGTDNPIVVSSSPVRPIRVAPDLPVSVKILDTDNLEEIRVIKNKMAWKQRGCRFFTSMAFLLAFGAVITIAVPLTDIKLIGTIILGVFLISILVCFLPSCSTKKSHKVHNNPQVEMTPIAPSTDLWINSGENRSDYL